MKFIHYLNEETSQDEVIETIINNCKPYLNFLKKLHWKWYFRRLDRVNGNFELKTARKDRKPSDTPLDIHNLFNAKLKEKFGWKARSEGVFTWPTSMDVNQGPAGGGLFFPVGDFDILWSEMVPDLYIAFLDYINIHGVNIHGKYDINNLEEWVDPLVASYKTKDTTKSYDNFDENEVIFKCDKYYLYENFDSRKKFFTAIQISGKWF